ncbi:MAG TPA: VOC family protein [Gaiellaceae bacterium]|nr:VOC family protein [Gaiellaceae bacterium]
MESVTTQTGSSRAPALPADLRLGAVHLTVANVERSVAWYERALGLVVHGHDAAWTELGDGSEPAVIVLHEDPAARPPGRHAGLYHYALLYANREALAHAAMRLAATQTPIQGASDHGTHEAIYLGDAEGNGIELAADRPREQWPRGLGYQGGPAPLDLDSLLSAAAGTQPGPSVDAGLRVGHVHLHVGDVGEGLAFYRDTLGFEEQANLGSAAFVSAGGYHHHVAFNVWRGRGVGPAPAHTVGLRHWTVVLTTEEDVASVRARVDAAGLGVEPVDGGFLTRDPSENAVVFGSAATAHERSA